MDIAKQGKTCYRDCSDMHIGCLGLVSPGLVNSCGTSMV